MAAQKPGRCDGAEGQYNLAGLGEGANEVHDAFVGAGSSDHVCLECAIGNVRFVA